ncbi:hypothetical protein CTAYLR_008882 [Chrysophaeum taylorii]|uniref:Uncharacterized protein n=1 Tax=Chrysophaeum taylorii TaxID=2483200 RepID=A0AAD7U6D0_9STRA|nr:hypothetical protein CTAYLR_008882 [Chrysophaeum taylorii]
MTSFESEEVVSPISGRRPFVRRETLVAPHESLRHLLKLHIQSQLRFAGPNVAVKLPRGASANLWIDIHVVDFVNEVATVWSLVEKACETRCRGAQMSAGARRAYDFDGRVVSAIEYARLALDEARDVIGDATVFPDDERAEYPAEFVIATRRIIRRLFHIYAHVYHTHFSALVALRCDQVVNELFRRFTLFALEFDLIDKYELEPLDELIRNLFQATNSCGAADEEDSAASNSRIADEETMPATTMPVRNESTIGGVAVASQRETPAAPAKDATPLKQSVGLSPATTATKISAPLTPLTPSQ